MCVGRRDLNGAARNIWATFGPVCARYQCKLSVDTGVRVGIVSNANKLPPINCEMTMLRSCMHYLSASNTSVHVCIGLGDNGRMRIFTDMCVVFVTNCILHIKYV